MQRKKPILDLASALLLRAFSMLSAHDSAASENDDTRRVHYTKSATAVRMLEDNDLWLGDALTSNDRSEYADGLDYAASALLSAWQLSLPEAETLSTFFEDPSDLDLASVWRIGRHMAASITKAENFSHFIFCLTSLGESTVDSLTMWVLYGGDGVGVALVMYEEILHYKVKAAHCDLFPVIYNCNHKSLIFKFLTVACAELMADRNRSSWIKTLADERYKLSPNTIYAASREACRRLILLMKDEAFEFEHEVRVIRTIRNSSRQIQISNSCSGRAKRHLSLRMITSSDEELPIREVWLGPRNKNLSEDQRILSWAEKRGVPVFKSRIPYRGTDLEGDVLATKYNRHRQMTSALLRDREPPPNINDLWDQLEEQAKTLYRDRRSKK